ncbi:MAG: UDP-N-acetylglucosamine 2-epimerase [Candidatus Paceibacterota bacterium]|jgi:GDP/UDP-N,N'-diacetylbacillosamine 2-epimerase (hydrolysing)
MIGYLMCEQKKRVAVVWSNRSEEGLLRPVIEELKKSDHFEVEEWKIPDDVYGVAEYVAQLERSDAELPDLAITPHDRPPVTLMAFFLYHVNVPLVQLHAGDISSGTFDDSDRWCISLWAKYHFCAGKIQAKRLRKFLRSMGKDPLHVYVSGVTNLDNLSKMSEPPDGDYDMVLYNPPTTAQEGITEELTKIINLLDKDTYWFAPNGDPGSERIESAVKILAKEKNIKWTATMPHESFLGLLSRAKRVIGNSSTLFFEAPHFGCEIIQIGERNRVRENVELKPGGSKRIVRRLEKWLN